MLFFGIKNSKEYNHKWIYAEDALQGSIKGLRCPFCSTPLAVKKPTKDKPAHFSHRKQACRYVRILRRLIIHFPMPEYWLYGISLGEKRLFNKLRRERWKMDNDKFLSFHKLKKTTTLFGKHHPIFEYEYLGKANSDTLEKILKRKLIKLAYHEFGLDAFELSWKTKLLWAEDWSLKEIYQEITVYWKNWQDYNRWDDWHVNSLFGEMNDRIEESYFYLVKITLDNKTLYKTGTTVLAYEKIEKWVHKELKRHGKKIAIEKVYYVDSISLIEPFIRWKYKKYIYKIGYQSGYFDFKKKYGAFKKDLHQVTLLSRQHSEKIRAGLKNAENVGKRGKETIAGFLAKPKSLKIISFLEDEEENWSVRSIAYETFSSINTVRKVKKLWEEQLKNVLDE